METRERKRRILLVDDEPDFGVLVKNWLEPRYECEVAPGGAGFERRLAESEPELVILDLRMEGRDGFELCRRMRSDARWRSIPVLFLTGSLDVADFQKNFAAGGTAYLMKPVGRQQLMTVVDDLLAEHYETLDVGGGD